MNANLVFLNGTVITVDEHLPRAQAVAVFGNRIAAVGGSEEVRKWVGTRTWVIDLNGRTLLPGFNDAHNHMLMFGQTLTQINAARVGSVDALVVEVAARAREMGMRNEGEWILGWGYDDTRLAEGRHPTRWDLDPVSGGHPVMITRTCGHIAAANSRALELAGIDRTTPDPPGGSIDRDPVTGEPTGVLRENAKALVERVLPRPTRERLVDALRQANEVYVREGITSQQDLGTGNLTLAEELGAWQEARRQGLLQVRSSVAIRYLRDFHEELIPPELFETGLLSGFGDDRLRIGPIKYFMDGGIGGATAYLSEPYLNDSSTRGILCLDQETVDRLVEEAHRLGYQLAVHAIGDEAVKMIVAAYERALNRYPRRDHRHRIEHTALTPPGLELKLKALGLIPVPQSPFLYHLGDTWFRNIGPDRMEWAFPLRRWLDAGLTVPLSSDRPVVYSTPLANIAAAVNRTSRGGLCLNPEHRISVEEAIRMQTLDAAYASFEEDRKGSVTVGKLADFVVLEADPTRVPPHEIQDIPVAMTVIDGEVVYTGDS